MNLFTYTYYFFFYFYFSQKVERSLYVSSDSDA